MDSTPNWFHVYNSTTGDWLHARKKWSTYSGAEEFSTPESAVKAAKRAPQTRGDIVVVLVGDFGTVE